MTLMQIVALLKARWKSIVAVQCVAIGFCLLALQLAPRQYTATSSVVLDVKSTDPVGGTSLQALAIGGYMATQVDIISSERVIARAIREMGLDNDAGLNRQWQATTKGQGDKMSWLAGRVLEDFKVLPSRESNVITVTYTSRSPELAARILNAIVNSYIETNIELRTEPAKQYNVFFDARKNELRAALEQAQERLSTFEREAGFVSSNENLDIENKRLADLSAQLVSAQSVSRDSNNRATMAETEAGRLTVAQSNPVVASLTADMQREQVRYQELLARYGDKHPQIVSVKRNIAELRAQVDAETKKAMNSLSMGYNLDRSRVDQLREALEAQRDKVLKFKTQRETAAVLLRDVDNAKLAYNAAFAQGNQSKLESQATLTNVSILKFASPPSLPSSPKSIKNLVVALVLGTLAGMAVAFVRERRDQRLRTDDDVGLLLGQPLFGVMPVSAPPSRKRRLLARFWKRRPATPRHGFAFSTEAK